MWEFPFPLASFKILSLIFVIFIVICLGVDLFGLIFVVTLCAPGPECLFFSPPRFGKLSSSIASSNFSDPSLSLLLLDVYDVNVHMLDVVPGLL